MTASALDPASPQPGIYPGVPDEVYHSIRLPSFHRLAPVAYEGRPWADYRKRLGDVTAEWEDESTAAMKKGRGLHLATLQPDVYAATITEGPINPKTGKGYGLDTKTVADFEAEHPGCLVLPDYMMEQVERMAECALHHPMVSGILQSEGVLLEATLIADIYTPNGCVRVKAKPDAWIPDEGLMCDLKGCADGTVAGFRKAIGRGHYHGQAGFYSLAAEAVGRPISEWMFWAVEWDAALWAGPGLSTHYVAPYRLIPESLAKGRETMGQALAALALHQTSDEWPGSPQDITDIGAPSWGSDVQPIWD